MCLGKESCLCKVSSIRSDREVEEGVRFGRVSNVRLGRVLWGVIKVIFFDDLIYLVFSGEGGYKMF